MNENWKGITVDRLLPLQTIFILFYQGDQEQTGAENITRVPYETLQ